MADVTFRYALDTTGVNRDNLVTNEEHDLTANLPTRVVVPSYTPFYGESVVVVDAITQKPLDRGIDYKLSDFLADPSAHYGKEIYSVILIINPAVNNKVRINYQVLGGHYTNDSSALIKLYQLLLTDKRPIDFASIRNKPFAYNPVSEHSHLMEDMYGFTAIVSAIERLSNAIILSNVPAFETLIDYINTKFVSYADHILNKQNPHEVTKEQVLLGNVENLPVVSDLESTAMVPVRKYVTYDNLLRTLLAPFAAVQLKKTSVKEGNWVFASVVTRNFADGEVLYWTIEHSGTSASDFNATYGAITIKGENAKFQFFIYHDDKLETNESFTIAIRTGGATGRIVGVSEPVLVINLPVEPENSFIDLILAGNIDAPGIVHSPKAYLVLDDIGEEFR